MKGEPLLASRVLPKRPHDRVAMSFKVYGGLRYLKGNAKPYFSLTYWEHRKGFPNQCESGGAGHDKILKYYPQFADLAAMHLSDIDGVPTHAEANGWYNLAGAALAIFADYVRVPLVEAESIKADVASKWNYPDMRARWKEICESMKPRWKAEADACIDKHKLVVYGDPWSTENAA